MFTLILFFPIHSDKMFSANKHQSQRLFPCICISQNVMGMSYLWCTSLAILVSEWAICVKPINGVRPDIVIRLTNQCDSISLCWQFLWLVLSTRKGIQVQYMLHLFNAFKQNLKSKTHLWHIDNLLGEKLWVKILHFTVPPLYNVHRIYIHFVLTSCCHCMYSFHPAEWSVIEHMNSVGPISKTGSQFKKRWTL